LIRLKLLETIEIVSIMILINTILYTIKLIFPYFATSNKRTQVLNAKFYISVISISF